VKTLLSKIFSSRLLKDIDEPVICNSHIVFFVNSYNGSKLIIYSIETGKIESITMKNVICFNAHAYDNYVVFEFSRCKRGIGILCVDTLEVKEIEYSNNVLVGGMWEGYIILKNGYDIVLLDINKNEEKIIASCHNAVGAPVIGYGNCAWLQLYKDKKCIAIYDILKDSRLVLTPPGYVNTIYLLSGNVIFQSCKDNKCCIYSYNIHDGKMTKLYESLHWIELYYGKNSTMVWTERKEKDGMYIFDIHVYNLSNNKTVKVLSDYKNIVIPVVSSEILLWVDSNNKGDNLCFMEIDV